MWNDEYQANIWHAGEFVSAGTYVRVDDRSHHVVTLDQEGLLPATFDGHVAMYRALEGFGPLKGQVSEQLVTTLRRGSGNS
jgi:hypothetical protein